MSKHKLSIDNSQVPEGYKQTEVGVIPEDWDVVAFSELFEFRNGVNADKQAYKRGIPFINVLEIITHTHLYPSHIPGRVSLPKSLIESYVVRYGDILFNRTSETQEEVGLASVYLGDERVVFGGFVIRGRNLKSLIDPIYSGYAFRGSSIRFQIIARGQGAVRANIGQEELSKILAIIPPLPEQRAIAQTLSDVDALIAAMDKLIAKKRNIKTATMQELLTGKKRLPGFGEEWKTMVFSEIASCRKDRIDPRKSGTLEFCIELEHIESGTGRLLGNTQTGYHSSLKAVFQPGDVLFGKLRSYLRKYWLADREGVCSTEIWVLVANLSLALSEFLYQIVTTEQFIDIASTAYGTHMPRSDWNLVKNYNVVVPPVEEQRAIASILSDMDAEIAVLEKRLAKTKAMKQGMMQELLTGKTRLVVPNKI